MTMPKRPSARRQKRDWPLFYARAMAKDKAKHWDKAEADINTGAETVARPAGAAELSGLFLGGPEHSAFPKP